MGGVAIIVIILAFIGNRIFGLYKDETTQRILEEAGTLKPKRPSPRAGRDGYPNQMRRGGAKLTPYQIQFQKDQAILKQMAARAARRRQEAIGAIGRLRRMSGLED